MLHHLIPGENNFPRIRYGQHDSFLKHVSGASARENNIVDVFPFSLFCCRPRVSKHWFFFCSSLHIRTSVAHSVVACAWKPALLRKTSSSAPAPAQGLTNTFISNVERSLTKMHQFPEPQSLISNSRLTMSRTSAREVWSRPPKRCASISGSPNLLHGVNLCNF